MYVIEDIHTSPCPVKCLNVIQLMCTRFATCQPFYGYAVHMNITMLLPAPVSEVLRNEGTWKGAVITVMSHGDPAGLRSSLRVSHTQTRLPARQIVLTAHSPWLSFLGDPIMPFISVTGEYLQTRRRTLNVGPAQVRCWAEETQLILTPETSSLPDDRWEEHSFHSITKAQGDYKEPTICLSV